MKLRFEGRDIEAPEGVSVLAALEAAGIAVDSSCRAGVCQSCLLQCLEGDIPPVAHVGLPKSLVAEGCFLSCACIPAMPLTIRRAGSVRQRVAVTLQSRSWLSPTVLMLRLAPQSPFTCRPGQFITLSLPDEDLARSYSIAACHADGSLELHVRVLPDGRLSQRLARDRASDSTFILSGPAGSCYYDDTDPTRRLVLAGTGTGLAPLWGILNEALARGHRGAIQLYHGARDTSGFYLVDALQALQARHNGFRYTPSLDDLVEVVRSQETSPADSEFFLCGDATLVNKLKRTLYLAGAKLDRLHADPFIAPQLRPPGAA